MRSRELFKSNTSTIRAHQQLCKVTSFYTRNHAINSKNWLLFDCCFALHVTFVGLMEGEGILKSCQTNLRKDDHMANTKCKRLHLPPLHDDVSQRRGWHFWSGGDNTWWLSDTTASCASTTSTFKSNIIEACKRRKKKNHRKEAWKRRKKKKAAAKVRPAKACPTLAKAGLTPTKAGLHEPAPFWLWSHLCHLSP
jgi:hypothetical protein